VRSDVSDYGMSVKYIVSIICMVLIHAVSSCTSGTACDSSARPLVRISPWPMFVMSARQPDRCSRRTLPFNMLHHQFYHILLTSCEQLFTPARKVYDRDPVAEYIHSDNGAHLSLLHTKPNRREGRTPSLLGATSPVHRRSPDATNIIAIATLWRLSPI